MTIYVKVSEEKTAISNIMAAMLLKKYAVKVAEFLRFPVSLEETQNITISLVRTPEEHANAKRALSQDIELSLAIDLETRHTHNFISRTYSSLMENEYLDKVVKSKAVAWPVTVNPLFAVVDLIDNQTGDGKSFPLQKLASNFIQETTVNRTFGTAKGFTIVNNFSQLIEGLSEEYLKSGKDVALLELCEMMVEVYFSADKAPLFAAQREEKNISQEIYEDCLVKEDRYFDFTHLTPEEAQIVNTGYVPFHYLNENNLCMKLTKNSVGYIVGVFQTHVVGNLFEMPKSMACNSYATKLEIGFDDIDDAKDYLVTKLAKVIGEKIQNYKKDSKKMGDAAAGLKDKFNKRRVEVQL